ncbi:MAG: NADH-quinone oxidoreductase subunit N, partial [Chloroflexota bacterium]
MNLYLFAPELSLAVLALLVIVLDLLMEDKGLVAIVAVAGLIVPAFLTLTLIGQNDTAFYGTLMVDSFSIIFKFLFLIVAALIILSSLDYLKNRTKYHGEFYALVLLATMGMMLMASAGEFISIYIGLELASISLYVLAGFLKDSKSSEASLKYLLLGAISS